MPVDLAYVEDKDISRILSRAAKWYMDVMVVSTNDIGLLLYSRKVKCLSLDQTRTFRSQNGPRTDQEKSLCILPLPSLDNIPGAPEYMAIINSKWSFEYEYFNILQKWIIQFWLRSNFEILFAVSATLVAIFFRKSIYLFKLFFLKNLSLYSFTLPHL